MRNMWNDNGCQNCMTCCVEFDGYCRNKDYDCEDDCNFCYEHDYCKFDVHLIYWDENEVKNWRGASVEFGC